MALTFNDLHTRVTTLFSDTTAATVTLAKSLVNESYKKALIVGSIEDQGVYYRFSVANEDTYDLPNDYRKLQSFQLIETDTSGTTTSTTANKLVDSSAAFGSALVGDIVGNTTDNTFTRITAVDSATTLSVEDDIFASGEGYQIGDGTAYVTEEVNSETDWNILKRPSVDYTSDVITNYFIKNNKIELYPTPNDSNHLLVFTYVKRVPDMTADDYTTGTVTVVKGSTTVTGSATTFTAAMVGRSIQVTTSGFWYRIKSFTSTTVVILEKAFQEDGSAGGAFTIGELPLIPEHLQPELTYNAIAFLYRRREELDLAREYSSLWNKAILELSKYGSSKTTGITVNFRSDRIINLDSSKDRLITKS
jgi:hypothetical protein